jgi:outer membrane protein assembly factor BamA
VGVFNVELSTDVLAPNYSSNFFGLGNETEKTGDSGEFYGYRVNNVDFQAQVSNELAELLTVRAGAGYEYFEPSATENRFVTSPESDLGGTAFAPYHYGTLHAGFTVNTVDSDVFPRYGVDFNVLGQLKVGINDRSSTFGRISTWAKIFYTLEEMTTTVASRVGFASNIGNYEFFQANTLGGRTFSGGSGNLRGFLRNRFAGRTSLYHNTDIRAKLFNVKSYLLPTSVGIWGFFDDGKVWTQGESSDVWHIGYGGGVWVSPLDRIVLTAGLAFSEEERLFALGLGFTF